MVVHEQAYVGWPDVVASIGSLALVAIIVVGVMWMRERTRQSTYDLISRALDKGQQLDPELLRQLTRNDRRSLLSQEPRARRQRAMSTGVILLAISGALVLIGYLRGEIASGSFLYSDQFTPAVVLGVIGVALLILGVGGLLTRQRDE